MEQTIEAFQNELNKNLVDRAAIRLLEEENYALRESLGFLSRNKFEYQMANVVSRGGIGESLGRLETMTIDKGALDGLKPGLAVVSSGGLVVGKILEVKDSIALVLLSNNDNCKFAATILGGEKTSGIAHGELGLTMKMEFIPQALEVKENDIVVTSGLEEEIPRGLVIGRIKQANKENNELWQTAVIEPEYNVEDLNIISVVLPQKK
jgi:rod shape-determining protein MreC